MQDWVVEVVSRLGVWGIALLMFLENVFPPLPSEVIMPLAGYLSTRGDLAFWPAVMAGSGGSLAGAMFWYWVGLRVSRKQLCDWVDAHGIWIAMTPEDVDRAVEWFQGHGRYSVLLGRLTRREDISALLEACTVESACGQDLPVRPVPGDQPEASGNDVHGVHGTHRLLFRTAS